MQSTTRKRWGITLIVIGVGWLLIGSALWLILHFGAPYGEPRTMSIGQGMIDNLLEDWIFVAFAALVTSVLPGLAVTGIGYSVRHRGLVPAHTDRAV